MVKLCVNIVLVRIVVLIISEMSHGRIYLIWVLPLVLLNFKSV